MARTSNLRNRSVAGHKREGKISFMIQSGWKNASIMKALEEEYPEYIPLDDVRRDPKSKHFVTGLPVFDATARQRAQEAIRSTRKQDADADADLDHLIEAIGGESGVKPLAESELTNLGRFSSGVPALDYIYGTTNFIYEKDDYVLNIDKRRYEGLGRFKQGDPLIPNGKGGWLETQRNTGRFEKIDIADPRDENREKRILVDIPILEALPVDLSMQKVEHGMPEAFASIWAGSPGVGKSRLAVSVVKAQNLLEKQLAKLHGFKPRPVIYYNGEAPEALFRQWSGTNIDPDLFLASHNSVMRLDSIERDVRRWRPRIVFIDSLQMIAEATKGRKGAEATLGRFSMLKADPDLGNPHFVIISQLNKKEEMAGSRYLEHMVDFVARVTRYEGREGMFLFDCPHKNRGGATPRGAIFQHTPNNTITCISTKRHASNILKLVQPIAPVAVPAVLGAAEAMENQGRKHQEAGAHHFGVALQPTVTA